MKTSHIVLIAIALSFCFVAVEARSKGPVSINGFGLDCRREDLLSLIRFSLILK